MKKYILQILVLLQVIIGYSQTLTVTDLGNDHMTCMTNGVDNTYTISAGYTDGFGFADQDIVINRVDLEGNVIWSKNISHLGIDKPQDLLTTTDSNYVLVGSLGKAVGSDLFIMKFDTLGNILWQKLYTGSTESSAYEVIEKTNNGTQKVYMLVGSHTTSSNDKDIVYMMFAEDGTIVIADSRGTTGNDEAYGLCVRSGTEDPLLVGYTDFYGTQDLIYNEMDFDGSSFVMTTYDGGGDEYGQDVLSFSTSVYFGTNTNSFSGGDWDMLFSYINSFNNTRSDRRYDFGGDDILNNFVSYTNNGFGVNGYATNTVTGFREGFHTWTDLSFNNEGGRFFKSCTANHEYYDEAVINKFAPGAKNTIVASSDRTNGTSDFVFENQTCFGESNNDQSVIFPVTWSAITNRTADFTNKGLDQNTIRDTTFTVQNYTLSLTPFCEIGTVCDLTLDISADDTIISCDGSEELSVTLDDCETILWSTGERIETITINTSGWVKATKTKELCSVSDSVYVFDVAEETFSVLEGKFDFCVGDTITVVSPSPFKPTQWTWIDGGVNEFLGTNDTIIYIPQKAGQFTLRFDFEEVCIGVTERKSLFTISQTPVFTLKDTSTCEVKPILNPNISLSGVSYLWSTGAQTSTIQANASGNYKLTARINTCSYTDSARVEINSSKSGLTNPIIQGPSSFCIGDTAQFIIPGVSESDSVLWEAIAGQPFALRDTVNMILGPNTVSGNYEIKAYPTDACEFVGVAQFSYRFDNVSADLTDSTDCDVTRMTYFLPEGMDSYDWSNGSDTSYATFYLPGEYTVVAKQGACEIIDTFSVSFASAKPGLYSGSKRSNIWHFGEDAGLDFNTEPPTVIRGSGISTREGCATICDEDGNLLLYTNGVAIWNKNHQKIANGYYGSGSSTQSSIIVPHPGNTNLYYIFTTPGSEQFSFFFGFCYILVDISAYNGFGAVIEHKENIYRYTTEKIVAVEHADGESIWIITHASPGRDGGGFNNFVTFKVTKDGFDETRIIQNIGSILHGGTEQKHRGQMKISTDGSKLALAVQTSGVELFDFDNATGVLSNPRVVFDDTPNRLYGLEFSPNGKYLYYSDYGTKGLYQYDTELPVDEAKNKIHSFSIPQIDSGFYFYGLQLAPNGKIYFAQDIQTPNISVINKPNLKGEAAEFSFNSLYLEGGLANLTFPSWITSYNVPSEPFAIVNSDSCSSTEIEFTTSPQSPNTYWDFGNGDLDTGMVVTRSFSAGGAYQVKVESIEDCDQKEGIANLNIIQTPNTYFDSLSLCANNGTYVYPSANTKIAWFKSNASSVLTTSNQLSFSTSGDYLAEVSNGSCKDSSFLHVFLEAPSTLGLSASQSNCFEDQSLRLDPQTDAKSYTWLNEFIDDQPLEIFTEGVYPIVLVGDSICRDTIDVKVLNQCQGIVFVPNAFTPNGDNLNDEFVPFTKFLTSYKVSVYNEWGELVFVSEDENTHWDGNYKGDLAQEGIYTYVLYYEYNYDNQKFSKEEKGFISLIR